MDAGPLLLAQNGFRASCRRRLRHGTSIALALWISGWAVGSYAEEENDEPAESDDQAQAEPEESVDEEDSEEGDVEPIGIGEELDFEELLKETEDDEFSDILTQEPASDEYEKTEKCINVSRMRSHEVLSDRFLVVHMSDGTKYLIQFESRCMGLRPGALLSFSRRSFRLCKNDEVRTEISSSGGSSIWSGPCRIPGFEPVTELQIEMLKNGLSTERVD